MISHLAGNPLRCDCKATELKQKLEGKLDVRYFMLSEKIECDTGVSLSYLDTKDLTCPLAEETCSQYGCNCTANRYQEEVTINCSSAGLKDFPIEVVELSRQEFSINLDLSNNEISDFPTHLNIRNYQNIEILNLTGNNVGEIEHKSLPSNLKYISLTKNEIKKWSKETVEYFKENKNLTWHWVTILMHVIAVMNIC